MRQPLRAATPERRPDRPARRTCGLLALLAALALGPAGVAADEPALRASAAAASQTAGPAPRFVERAATAATLRALRRGGFVLYLRHGPTDNTRGDRVPAVDLDDCSTQRPLTPEGRQVAADVGQALRSAGIPIDEFRVSPLCRTRESAAAAFPARTPVVDPLLMYLANFTSAQKAPIIAHTLQLLSAPVPPRGNRLLLAHAPNLMELMGYFPREGTLVVLRPLGAERGFEYVASIAPTDWKRLMK